METNMKELNLEEMEMANGGGFWDKVSIGGFYGGVIGFGAAALGIAAVSNPVGLVATAVIIVGATAAGTAAGGGIGAVVSAITD